MAHFEVMAQIPTCSQTGIEGQEGKILCKENEICSRRILSIPIYQKKKKKSIANNLRTPLPKFSVPEMGSWLNFKWWIMAEEPSQRWGNSNKILFYQNLNKELGFDFRSCDWWSYFLPHYIFKKLKWVNREKHENRAHRKKEKLNLPYKRERKSLFQLNSAFSYICFLWKIPCVFIIKDHVINYKRVPILLIFGS